MRDTLRAHVGVRNKRTGEIERGTLHGIRLYNHKTYTTYKEGGSFVRRTSDTKTG